MKKTRVLLVDDEPLVRTTVRLALESLGYTIVGIAMDRSETLSFLTEFSLDLVVISPSVLEKTGMGLVREVLAKQQTSVLVIPGHPTDLFARSLSLLRPADLSRLVAVIRVVQTLFGRRHFVLN
ncbi:MAG: response regulator [Candidatus Binatia bacterium]